MNGSPIAPWWIVLPLAAVALLVTAAHMIVLREAPAGLIPESRRRIRTASGWVIMLAIPITAYAFGIVTPSQAGMFMFAWLAVIGLLFIILMLAAIDLFDSRRHAIDERAAARRELTEARQRAMRMAELRGNEIGRDDGEPDA